MSNGLLSQSTIKWTPIDGHWIVGPSGCACGQWKPVSYAEARVSPEANLYQVSWDAHVAGKTRSGSVWFDKLPYYDPAESIAKVARSFTPDASEVAGGDALSPPRGILSEICDLEARERGRANIAEDRLRAALSLVKEWQELAKAKGEGIDLLRNESERQRHVIEAQTAALAEWRRKWYWAILWPRWHKKSLVRGKALPDTPKSNLEAPSARKPQSSEAPY